MNVSNRRRFDSSDDAKKEYRGKSIKIALIYLVVGLLWIYFSDRLAFFLFQDKEVLQIVATYKGWFYVLASTVMLYLLISHPLKALEASRADILNLSYNDTLTGLHNRRYYEEKLQKLDNSTNYPISIIMADIDGLKIVNDAFGHQLGDELIKKAADAVQSSCRSKDIVARWGGDEFVILLPRTTKDEAEKVAIRIEERCNKSHLNFIQVSISLGLSLKTKDEEDLMEVLKEAEDEMYKNKSIKSQELRAELIEAIIKSLYKKSPTYKIDAIKVQELCEKAGIALGLPHSEISKLKILGMLYNIGNIGIDEKILNKDHSLSAEEMKEVQRHSDIGYRILSASNELMELAQEVLAHHERWDGNGYPQGLKGEEIPYLARIISLAGSYASMSGERPYRDPMSKEEIIAEIEQNAGHQFDPELTKVFIKQVIT